MHTSTERNETSTREAHRGPGMVLVAEKKNPRHFSGEIIEKHNLF